METKRKSIAFVGVLLLVSTVLVGSAVASTNSALQPFLRGEGFAEERSLTRGHHAALAILIKVEKNGALEPVDGATVVVTRLKEGTEVPVTTQTTGPRGGAAFDLKPGPYKIVVQSDAGQATKDIRLHKSLRLGLTFDSEGQPHWREVQHRDLERRGEHKDLLVRVGEAQRGARPQPVAGATVEVHKINADNTTSLVGTMTTGPRGFASFALPQGGYVVKVKAENATGETRLRLNGNVVAGAIVQGDDIEWRISRSDSHDFQRPSQRPSPSPTRGR